MPALRYFPIVLLTGLLSISIAAAQTKSPTPAGNLVQNSGFEHSLPTGGWVLASTLAQKGIGGNSIFGIHSGAHSLRLVPTSSNSAFYDTGSFGIAQSLDFSNLAGKPLYYGGWLQVSGGASAVIRITAGLETGEIFHREIRLATPNGTPVRLRDIMDIPNASNINRLIFSCEVEGSKGNAFFDDIFATPNLPTDWDMAAGVPDPGDDLVASVTVQADQVVRQIPRELFGQNMEFPYNGNGIWDVANDRLNPDLVQMGSDLGVSLLRFPGGFFSDFYHWTDGIGPPGLRPVNLTEPSGSYTTNRFGTDEAQAYADAIGSKLWMTVNVETGNAQEAANWVKYVNNGNRRVDYWEVGNELYVDLTALDPTLTAIPPDVYAKKFLDFAAAMRAVDPTIKLGAIIDYKFSEATYRPFPHWTETVLQIAGSQIDFLAAHNGFAPALGSDAGWSARTVYASMLAAPILVKSSLASLSGTIDSVMGTSGSNIQIAVTEWTPLFDTDLTSRFLDHTKTLASALYCASMLKVFIESPRVSAAVAFKLVDPLYLSWIGLRDGKFVPKASYYAMQLYTKHFGTQLVNSSTVSPGYEARSIGWVDAVPFVPYLETVASKSDDGQTLSLMVINKHFDRNIKASIDLKGFCASGTGKAWNLNGTALDANTGTQLFSGSSVPWPPETVVEPNGRFYQGGEGEIWVDNIDISTTGNTLTHVFPAHSVTAIQLTGSGQSCQ